MSYQHAEDNWFAAILIGFIALSVLVNIWRARGARSFTSAAFRGWTPSTRRLGALPSWDAPSR